MSLAASHEINSAQALTLEDVGIVAQRTWGRDAEIISYKIDQYSQEKLGFLSLHRSLTIWIRENGRKNYEARKYFVKWLPVNGETLDRDMVDSGVFDREAAFYAQAVPLLRRGFKAESWAPECYLITKEAIVFEDLRTRGFSMRNKLFTKEETMSGLTAIARMHAASILAEKRLGKRLDQVCPDAFDTSGYHDKNGLWQKYFLTALDLTTAIAQQLGLGTSKIVEASERFYDFLEPSREKQNAITQSDLWSNNLMFDNCSPPNCIIIDYQLMRYCPLAQDVISFLYLCTNREFRRLHQDEMIKFYYSELCRVLRMHQPEIFVPEWSEIEQGVEEQTLCAVIIALLFFPTVLMNGKISAELLKRPEDYMTFRYVDKKRVVLPLLKEEGEYAERIKESVVEFVEMAEKLDQVPRPR